MWRQLAAGAAAGAAGTTALNAVTYLDMAVRGRPASSTPERSVEAIAERAGLSVPGEGETRDNRLGGIGALSGIATGVAVGALFGGLRAFGLRPGPLLGTVLVGLSAMAATDSSMARLGISDPRSWSAADWLSDLVPHLAYGAVVSTTLEALDRRQAH
ncbi:hypothetical protein [Actinoplanes sp. NPDC049681]|uniref:hypothetical protein n=1 Tax=Actinoplanes sp. NPDC049681 TaxID=3363905 RepID=UPI0037BBF310